MGAFRASRVGWWSVVIALAGAVGRAERINQEGRILGPEVSVTAPILFNTAEADVVLSAMQIMPLDSAWNEDISTRPLLPNSATMIAQIRADLASGRRTLRAFHEMNFVLVPDHQPLVPIAFLDYPDESDPSPYPIAHNTPVETWPRETGSLTLTQWQQDVNNTGGDRHAIIVMPGTGSIWETWQMRLVGSQWQASNGARFDLRTNQLRPAGWTSADAAGLPMFPALVRYDECVRGMVEHAMRIVVRRTRREYVYPATHYASSTPASEVNVPAMGQRVRLRADFPIPEHWTIFEKAVLRGLKKYGALIADNGNFFSISVTPDDRYPAGAFDRLATIDVNEFEVVQTTGPDGGPRSPGAPTVDAGGNFAARAGTPAVIGGIVSGTATVEWSKYSGPGTVTFADPSQPISTLTFDAPGTYTLMLSARDGVHAVARDAVVVTVVPAASEPEVAIALSDASVALGAAVLLTANVTGETASAYQWFKNGLAVAGATASALQIPAMSAADTGVYTVNAAVADGTLVSDPAILGLATKTNEQIVGSGLAIAADIVHPNGGIYDQVLVRGSAVALRADPGQVLRASYLDLSDDIVQVEFSGAGTLSLLFDEVTGPARPVNYNQDVDYVRGHAGIVITDADETTHVSVFSVGRVTALNPTLFRSDVDYDGVADLAYLAIASRNGRFGSVRVGNASFVGTRGIVGIFARDVQIEGVVNIGDVTAGDAATPRLQFGATAVTPRITGGELRQLNGRAVQVSGITRLEFTAGTDSHGVLYPARPNQARLEEDGVDVTDRSVVGP